jgi:alpha-L-fucosidase
LLLQPTRFNFVSQGALSHIQDSKNPVLRNWNVDFSQPFRKRTTVYAIFGRFNSATNRTAWYRNAKFGMFIHWGPYSLASVEASWPIMRPKAGGITEAEYRALPQRFNPTKFDPKSFVDLARSAGQQYMVFTTKHHDGFCMFDSAYTEHKITRTPYGKDIVAQLATAAKHSGMPLGFYYSPPDLYHPGFRDTSKLVKRELGRRARTPRVATLS